MQSFSNPQELTSSAFPAELADDVQAVLAVMPASRHRPVAPFSVMVQGQQVSIPGRIYNDELSPESVAALSSRQQPAAAESAGRPWPSLAPSGSTRVDGYC
ncbi:hypothetical protein [Streptacidiphilus sp. PAMC 29251]